MRSTGRIPKSLPILLIGSDLEGRVFSEHTSTVLLSLHGAGIVSKHKLSPDQELILRLPDRNSEAEIRVVGQLGLQNSKYTYGVAFLDPLLNFWNIEFPPVTPAEREAGLLSLVCSICQALEKIDDTSIEADICATNDGVLRSCKRCGAATLWKPAPAVSTPESVSVDSAQLPLFSSPLVSEPEKIPAPPPNSIPERAPVRAVPSVPATSPSSFYAQPYASEQLAAPSPPAVQHEPQATVLTMPAPEKTDAPRVNRRKHPRVKVNYSACIRHQARDDDMVTCEDMSKGGIRFTSRTQYYEQSLIEVAVPYQHGQPAIFVPAKIVFVEELPERRLFRCGVQYLKSTRARDCF